MTSYHDYMLQFFGESLFLFGLFLMGFGMVRRALEMEHASLTGKPLDTDFSRVVFWFSVMLIFVAGILFFAGDFLMQTIF